MDKTPVPNQCHSNRDRRTHAVIVSFLWYAIWWPLQMWNCDSPLEISTRINRFKFMMFLHLIQMVNRYGEVMNKLENVLHPNNPSFFIILWSYYGFSKLSTMQLSHLLCAWNGIISNTLSIQCECKIIENENNHQQFECNHECRDH